MEKIALGLKLHNPFNIRKGSNWIGLAHHQFPSSFCDFTHELYATRAFLIILRTYVLKHHVKTVRQFVNRYAPAGDGANNPDVYCAHILNCWRAVDFDVADRSDVFDKSWFKLNIEEWSDKALFLYAFVAAVARIETGYKLTANMFNDAYKMI